MQTKAVEPAYVNLLVKLTEEVETNTEEAFKLKLPELVTELETSKAVEADLETIPKADTVLEETKDAVAT